GDRRDVSALPEEPRVVVGEMDVAERAVRRRDQRTQLDLARELVGQQAALDRDAERRRDGAARVPDRVGRSRRGGGGMAAPLREGGGYIAWPLARTSRLLTLTFGGWPSA